MREGQEEEEEKKNLLQNLHKALLGKVKIAQDVQDLAQEDVQLLVEAKDGQLHARGGVDHVEGQARNLRKVRELVEGVHGQVAQHGG